MVKTVEYEDILMMMLGNFNVYSSGCSGDVKNL